jgi:hypothetical protein
MIGSYYASHLAPTFRKLLAGRGGCTKLFSLLRHLSSSTAVALTENLSCLSIQREAELFDSLSLSLTLFPSRVPPQRRSVLATACCAELSHREIGS